MSDEMNREGAAENDQSTFRSTFRFRPTVSFLSHLIPFPFKLHILFYVPFYIPFYILFYIPFYIPAI
jgi:hypothetical protein